MNDIEPFRTLLTINALIAFPTLFYHRIQSQRTHEKLDRRQEGVFILATLRPIGLVLLLTLFAYMVNPDWMAWASVELPRWLRWMGIALCATGTILISWTLSSLGKNLTDTVVTREAHTLVTRGPYRWVRHPFYVSVTLFILGNSLAAANWFFLATGCVVLALLLIRTRTEEEKMVARFGDDYRGYMKRTGRFFPRLSQGDQHARH
jgi:protein-S-isoprenylcysteine O-methyltransferase Ste14